MSLADDIDEDLDEMDDEDIDDAFADDDLSERRRRKRRHNVKGRGYSSPRRDSSPVSQTQMQAALARVAADVRKLAASQRDLESRVSTDVKRLRTDSNNSNQMAALMPFLFKPKAKTLQELTTAGELLTAKFQVESDDSLSMMLPLLMMSGMGQSGNNSGGGGDNNMMMLAVALMATRK